MEEGEFSSESIEEIDDSREGKILERLRLHCSYLENF